MPFSQLHVTQKEFQEQCAFIRRHCDPISIEQLRNARDGKANLSSRPVLITFDDGYLSVLTLALPVLNTYRLPATVFACTYPAQYQTAFWHDAVALSLGEAAVEALKSVPFDQWKRVVDKQNRSCDPNDPTCPLSIDDLVSLASATDIEIGAHTVSHPILANASLEEQRKEIVKSKQVIGSWIGREITVFAYPNGRPGLDFGPDTVDLVREAGFKLAFTTRHGFLRDQESDLELSRFLMLAGISRAEFAHRLTYSWQRPNMFV